MSTSSLVTIGFAGLAAIFLSASGIKRKPGLGIVLSVIIIVVAARMKHTSFAQMGFVPPESWLSTVLLGLLIGGALGLLSMILVEPLIERLTGQPHDLSVVAGVQSNWKALLSWLVAVWAVAAIGEELIYRGFLMSQISKVLGTGILALAANVLITSIVFGLSHSYQGQSGGWSTGIIGICLGIIYILSGFNLWLPILVHGAIDTAALIVISLGADQRLRELVWKNPQPAAS